MRARARVDLFSLHFFAVRKLNKTGKHKQVAEPSACVFVRALTQLDVFISATRTKTQQAGGLARSERAQTG
jgi:hypothetical protein